MTTKIQCQMKAIGGMRHDAGMPVRSTLIVGLGNPWRRDDGAGPAVLRRLHASPLPPGVALREQPGDVLALLAAWEGWPRVIVIDAVRSGAPPGTVHRCGPESLGDAFGHASSHRFGLADAVELARALGRLPDSLTVYGIEGSDFGPGEGLTPAVAQAVDQVGCRLIGELANLLSQHH